MSTKIRRKSASVIDALLKNPDSVPFFQAVRLMERASFFYQQENNSALVNPVGRFTPPPSEIAHFSTNLTLGFPVSEILKIEEQEDDNRLKFNLIVNFLGLTGSTGVLPFNYSELIFQRLKMKDQSLKDFFDMFHHRTVSLFFQAGLKYRLPISVERHKLLKSRKASIDSQSHALLSLIGLGTDHLTENMRIHHEAFLFYSGFFNQRIRPESNLKQMVSHYFGVPAYIEQHVGKWHELIDDVRSRLGWRGNPKGQNVCLGRSAILGAEGWFAQGRIRIVLGPLNEEQYQRFAPGTRTLAQLDELVKFFTGGETETEYVLKVSREHIPHRIQLKQKQPPTIGWNSWLATKPLAEDRRGETLDISVSSGRLH